MSAGLEMTENGLDRLQAALRTVLETDYRDLFEVFGGEAVSQTQRRIAEEKRAPDGSRWPAWSEGYAATRHGNQTLLQSSGALIESMTHNVLSARSVEVGSNVAYAAIHNFGGKVRVTAKSRRYFWAQYKKTGDERWKRMALTKRDSFEIPQREFLGVSPDDEEDLVALVQDFLASRMGGLLS